MSMALVADADLKIGRQMEDRLRESVRVLRGGSVTTLEGGGRRVVDKFLFFGDA